MLNEEIKSLKEVISSSSAGTSTTNSASDDERYFSMPFLETEEEVAENIANINAQRDVRKKDNKARTFAPADNTEEVAKKTSEFYNENGFDINSLNKNGYNINGLDENGLNEYGYNINGTKGNVIMYPNKKIKFKRAKDNNLYNQYGFDINGFNKDGYDMYGFDIIAFD